MRVRVIWAAMIAGIAFAAPARSQSPLDGPLAAPGVPASADAPHHSKTKPKKARHAAARPVASPDTAGAARAVPADPSAPGRAAPGDAVDLGMKWNGSNDGAAQTKFQSGPNTSSGSGAEVGMKLHF